jgi:hypothetical protein
MLKPFKYVAKLIVEERKGRSNLADAIFAFDGAKQLKPGKDV